MSMFGETHMVPAAGLPTWPAPDVNQVQGPPLVGDLPVKVVQWWGDWANVECSNGWTTWVDGRHLQALVPAAPTYAPSPANAPAPTYAAAPALDTSPVQVGSVRVTLPLVGAVAAGLSVFLPWLSTAGVSNNAMSNTPFAFLFDNETQDTGGIQIGWVVLALAAVAVVLSIRPGGAPAQFRRAVGWALVLIPTVFVAQLQRNVGDAEAGTVFSFLGFGVYVALVGALFVALGKTDRP